PDRQGDGDRRRRSEPDDTAETEREQERRCCDTRGEPRPPRLCAADEQSRTEREQRRGGELLYPVPVRVAVQKRGLRGEERDPRAELAPTRDVLRKPVQPEREQCREEGQIRLEHPRDVLASQ